MDANTDSLIFLLFFVVFFIFDSMEFADTTSMESSELNAADRYAVADQISI